MSSSTEHEREVRDEGVEFSDEGKSFRRVEASTEVRILGLTKGVQLRRLERVECRAAERMESAGEHVHSEVSILRVDAAIGEPRLAAHYRSHAAIARGLNHE